MKLTTSSFSMTPLTHTNMAKAITGLSLPYYKGLDRIHLMELL